MTTMDQRRDTTPQVTFHGHDQTHGEPQTNYHAHTASNELATFTHPTHQAPVMTQQTLPTHQQTSMMQPMATTTDTSSRRNSYQDDAVINKTTQLYAATPRSAYDSAIIRLTYTLGFLGLAAMFAWFIILLIFECLDYELNQERSYNIALQPFLYQLPYFMACSAFMFMAGKRNTTLAWFLFTVSNFFVACFWALLIVPYFVQFAYAGDSNGDASCPANLQNADGSILFDSVRQCRLRKGAIALSCGIAFLHFTWFLIGLVQTIRHWKTIIVLDAAYPSKQMWLLLMVVEAIGFLIWMAGNLRLTYLGVDDTQLWSNQILRSSTYMLSLLIIVCMVMTAYAILDASKLYVGITAMFHLCATLMLWSVFIWVARWSNGFTDLSPPNQFLQINEGANKTIAAGLGIVTACETIFTVCFLIAYKVMPDLFLTQPNLTGPAAV